MYLRSRRAAAFFFVLCGPLFAAAADVAAVYNAILHGDYQAGRAELTRLLKAEPDAAPVLRVKHWLDSYQALVTTRQELRQHTFDWNVAQARKALAADRTYLALSFAAQARAYAADEDRYVGLDWVQQLKAQALAQASRLEAEQHWVAAHSHYALLERLWPRDERIRELRKRAARHVRLELVYPDKQAVERRIKDVTPDILRAALWRINERYYEPPDFKQMAAGALENLLALCQTTRLYEISVFDGVANPAARAYFLGKLDELGQTVRGRPRFGYRDMLALFNELNKYNRQSVSLPGELLVVEFLEGALARLDDFTSVVWPVDAPEFDKLMMGGFQGVGIQLTIDEYTGRLKVVTPLEDSPALEAGVQPDDLIVAVNGQSTRGWTTDKAVREITGKAGTKVVLTMFRPSTRQRIDFPLVRRKINLRTVRGVRRIPGRSGPAGWDYLLDPAQGIAYIKLTNFNPGSGRELARALAQARKQGMRALILDLRFNPGGLLDVAVQTVSAFLESGEVVSTRGRSVPPQHLQVRGDAAYRNLPLVVLINDTSASASEILAGALRDQGRAVLLGERSYGKGSVQRLLPLGERARLKLTTALYYLPSGRSPHKDPRKDDWGVAPDWQVVLTPKETSKILERERSAYIIKTGPPATQQAQRQPRAEELEALKVEQQKDEHDFQLLSAEDIKLLRDDPYQAPDVDPQLETALLHLRVKLAGNLPWPRELAARTPQQAAP